MGVAFCETMRGHVIDSGGKTHLMDLELRAEATHWPRFLMTGETRVCGLAYVQPWAVAAPLVGTLRISPLCKRRIEYKIRFQDGEGHEYVFAGRKDLSAWRLLQSVTHLRGALYRDGETIAEGALHFDLNELPAFLSTWSLKTAFETLDLEAWLPSAGDGVSQPFDPWFARSRLVALAEAILEPGRHVPAPDDTTVNNALEILAFLPPQWRKWYTRGLFALDLAARVRYGRSFAALSVARRRSLFRFLERRGGLGAGALQALSVPIKSAHFSRRDYLDSIGVPRYENPVGEPEARHMANVLAPDDLEESSMQEADVVVIGTGAGGATVAAHLAEQGLAVAVMEEGRYALRADFSGPLERRLVEFWRAAGMNLTQGNLPMSIPTGRLVGGSTAINSGTCFSTPAAVLEEWRREHGLPEDFAPPAFARFLKSVLTELQVEPADRRYLGHVATLVARGADALGAPHGPLPRNAPGCDGQGVCPVGCPTDARRSTNVSYLPRALRAGAFVFTGMKVTRLLRRGRRVAVVEALGQGVQGAPRLLRVQARAVVVACGALASPLLLATNQIRLPALGRNLSVHPALGMFAMCAENAAPWRAIPQSYGVEDLVDPRVRFEGFYGPPQLSAPAYPYHGAELTRWMDAQARVVQYGFMVRDHNVGRVRRGPGGRPSIHYDITADVLNLFQKGAVILAELLLRGGAQEVLTGIRPALNVKTLTEARALADLKLKPADFQAMAFHPLGTCRMGASADRAVVDFEHRVFGTENLYVIDGSTVPTSLGVNPQVTIMAMATRAAEILGQRLAD